MPARIQKATLVLSLLWLVFSAAAHATAAPRDPDKYFFDTTLGDFTDELAQAKQQGKKGILIFFEEAQCPFCHRMKTTVLNQPKVQEFFKKNFLIYSLDTKSSAEITDFSGHATTQRAFFYKVTHNRGATPVFAFFDLKGNLVVRYTGATSGIDEFMWLGKYASTGMYAKTSFTRYKREMRKEEQ